MFAELLAIGAIAATGIATYLLHSTFLLGGVWLLFRLRPATGPTVREALWKIALVGGLITTPAQILLNHSAPIDALTLTVPMWNRNDARTDGASQPENEIEFISRDDEIADIPLDDLVIEYGGGRAEIGLEVEPGVFKAVSIPVVPQPSREPVRSVASPPLEKAVPHSPQETLLLALFIVAAFFFAVGIGRHLWQTRSLRQRLAGAVEVTAGPVRDMLDELCRTVPRAPAVRLLSAPRCVEPAAFGIRQWTIVLPAQAERDLSVDELRSLLAHELAHLVRGDMWWLLISRLVCSCGGFQPFNHLARREWQRAAEYLCDAWAVSRTGNRLALARCLTEVASWRLLRPDCAASLAATGSRSGLADRIERLVDGRPIADPASTFRTRRRLIGAAVVVLAGLIASGPRIQLSTAAPAEIAGPAGKTAGRLSPTDRGTTSATRRLDDVDPARAAPKTEATHESAPTSDTIELFGTLDDELRSLQRELTELQPLLEQPQAPPEAHRLAELLKRETERLEEHRAELNRSISPAPGERGASAP